MFSEETFDVELDSLESGKKEELLRSPYISIDCLFTIFTKYSSLCFDHVCNSVTVTSCSDDVIRFQILIIRLNKRKHPHYQIWHFLEFFI